MPFVLAGRTGPRLALRMKRVVEAPHARLLHPNFGADAATSRLLAVPLRTLQFWVQDLA
jgi:hypothetical protein